MIPFNIFRRLLNEITHGIPFDVLWCDDSSVVVDRELYWIEISFVANIAKEFLIVFIQCGRSQPNSTVDTLQAGLVIRFPVRANHLKQTETFAMHSGLSCLSFTLTAGLIHVKQQTDHFSIRSFFKVMCLTFWRHHCSQGGCQQSRIRGGRQVKKYGFVWRANQ